MNKYHKEQSDLAKMFVISLLYRLPKRHKQMREQMKKAMTGGKRGNINCKFEWLYAFSIRPKKLCFG